MFGKWEFCLKMVCRKEIETSIRKLMSEQEGERIRASEIKDFAASHVGIDDFVAKLAGKSCFLLFMCLFIF